MRLRLLAPALLLVAAGPAAAADPPVTFQTLPVGRVLNDARAVVGAIAGPKEVGKVNEAIKEKLGEKGFAGFDLGRPLLGYVHLPADPTQAVGVLVVPVTGEAEFLGFFERLTGTAPKAAAGGLYALPAGERSPKVALRFADGHAYLAAGAEPEGVLAKDALVPAAKLHDPGDTSLLAVRVHFDRLPPELRATARALLAEAKKTATMLPFPEELAAPAEKAVREAIFLGERYLKLSEGAKEATARLAIDPVAADLTAEFTVVPLPNTDLARALAARKATTNRFAGLVTPDTAVGFTTRLPFFNDELKRSATGALDSAEKAAAGINGPSGDLLRELAKGAGRTVKTGEFDVAGAIRGPDKDGRFTGVLAVAFEDTAAVEKALKGAIDTDAPPELRRAIKWNAEKVGAVNVHRLNTGVFAQNGPVFGPDFKPFGGPESRLVFAFTPHAAYLAVGPDPLPALKEMLAARPAEAPVLDVVLNPSRMIKFMTASGANPGEVDGISKTFGTDNRPITVAGLSVTGGAELKVTGRISLRALVGVGFGHAASATFEQVDPPPPPKN